MCSWRVLLPLMLLSGIGTAQALECGEAKKLSHASKDYVLELCKAADLPSEEGKTRVLIKLYESKTSVPITLDLPLEVEGMVRKIAFDSVNYPVSKQYPVFGVVVESRLAGSGFDQYGSDLHLIMLGKDKQLRHILSLNTGQTQWGRHCEPECVDTSKSTSRVLISPRLTNAWHDLIVRSKSETKPYGSEKVSESSSSGERYVWNGKAYEKAQ